MDVRPEQSRETGGIDLAHEPGFLLGMLRVSPSTREVRARGIEEIVEPRVMQVLVCLARGEGSVISRDDLIQCCWGGRIVGEDAINRCIAKVRQIADRVDGPSFVIETIPRVGYRLRRAAPDPVQAAPEPATEAPPPAPREEDTPARVVQLVPAPEPAPAISAPRVAQADAASAAPDRPRLRSGRRWMVAAALAILPLAIAAALLWRPLSQKGSRVPPMLSVAVLPIENLTGDPSLDQAADRMTEDLTYAMSRGGYLSVAPRSATFAYKAKHVDERLLGQQLHVRHIVSGSLRKSDPGFRVSYQMVDTVTGEVVDSRDFGRANPDGSVPEGQLAMSLFNQIAPALKKRWRMAALAMAPDDSDPDNVMARFEQLADNPRPEEIQTVERLIAAAQASIPKTSSLLEEFDVNACYYYSEGLVGGGYYASAQQRSAWAQTALDFARRAAELRPQAASPHSCRAEAFAQLERWDEGMAEAEYVIETFPLTAIGYEAKARLEFARGLFRDALRDYTELAARDPGESHHVQLGLSHLFLGAYEEAVRELREQAVVDPTDPSAPFFLSAALALSGHTAEAITKAKLYGTLKKDDGLWATLALSHEPAFLQAAAVIRNALHKAGLEQPPGPPSDQNSGVSAVAGEIRPAASGR